MTDTHHESHLPLFSLITRIKEVIHTSRTTAAYNINTLQVRTNFEIGRLIVEYEQGGSERADYGKQTIPELSKKLTSEFGRGFSRSNLENMRRFYIEYSSSADRISQTLSGKLSGDSPETRIIHDPHPAFFHGDLAIIKAI